MRRSCPVTMAPAYQGMATAGTSTSLTDGNIAGTYADDFFTGFTLKLTAGTGNGATATVTSYVGATGQFVFTGGLSDGSTPTVTTAYRISRSLSVIDGDSARYMLPVDFGGEAIGDIEYVANTHHVRGIEWVNESFIRSRRAITVITGFPRYAAILPYQPTTEVATVGRQWELIFDPRPVAADTVTFPYIMHFDGVQLISGTCTTGTQWVGDDDTDHSDVVLSSVAYTYPDNTFNGYTVEITSGTGRSAYGTVTDFTGSTGTFRVDTWSDGGEGPDVGDDVMVVPIRPYYHPCGFAFDGIAETACLAACEIYGGDRVQDTHHTEMYYKMKLPEAIRANNRMRPRGLGLMTNGPRRIIERVWNNVITNHDIWSHGA